MVTPPSLKTRKICANLLYCVLFLAIASVTYLGFRPSVTSAESTTKTLYDSEKYAVSLKIPEISLDTEVVEVDIKDHGLEAPAKIVGTYRGVKNKELLIAHSTTAFKNLKKVTIGAEIIYRGTSYTVTEIETAAKEDIDMNEVLKPVDESTLILMTCYGTHLSGDDYSHRLLVTAKR